MPLRVAIIYNAPSTGAYSALNEDKAELGVLEAVVAVDKALNELGYLVARIPLLPPLKRVRAELKTLEVDVVFNLFEGFTGQPETEAIVADMLAESGLTYTGCPGGTIALALDKVKAKTLLETSGFDTPGYQLLTPNTIAVFNLPFPCIVKPAREHASHSLSAESVVNDYASLEGQVAKVSQFFGGKALVEKFVDGREFNATILSNGLLTVLPISEIVYTLPATMPRILTFEAKWEPESIYFQHTQAVCPAKINREESDKITEIAKTVSLLFGCRGYSRVDMRQDSQGKLKVLEVNPNPDISPGYGAARQAQAAGLSYDQFIEKLVMLALEGRKR